MKEPINTPWWQPAVEKQPRIYIQKRNNSSIIVLVVVVSLIAGAIGATIGRNTTDNLGANLVQTENVVERAPGSIAALAARLIPAVVSISVNGSGGSGTGSGFFLDSDGYILTNNHVVESAANSGRITVETSDGKKYPAKLIGRDNSYDLAVLKINVQAAPTLQLGNSDQVLVGDAVIAIGSPLGLSGTVTAGIISSKNRAVTTGNGFGESSAIATLGVSSQAGSIGLGFAIPINQAKKTAEQLIDTGFSTYPIMGISVDTQFTGTGALISSESTGITPGGPADKAGLRKGDIIVSLDGAEIENSDELIVVIRSKNIGDKVKVKFKRNSITREVDVVLAASKK